MIKCFGCWHFKQTAPLEFNISGYCNWQSSVKLPAWLQSYVESKDNFYGPKRQVGKRYSGHEVTSCDTFELTDEYKVTKRKSEEWYD